MIINVGKPPCDGRYIALVPIENSEYCAPIVSDVLRGNWLWRNNVLGWIGPLPEPVTAASLREAAAKLPKEYDL